MSDELHTVAHEIRWPSKLLDGADSVTLHGHNAIADYRAYVHKDATSRELVYKDDAGRQIRELQAKLKEAEDSDAESLRMYRSARDRADELQARVAELERDAGRYRFLRDAPTKDVTVTRVVGGATIPRYAGNMLDQLIDDILAERGERE